MRNPLLPLAALTAIGSLFLIAACGEIGKTSEDAGDVGLNRSMSEWTDPSTGCVYYIYRSGWGNAAVGGMTAKLRRDGIPECPGVEGDIMKLEETPFP